MISELFFKFIVLYSCIPKIVRMYYLLLIKNIYILVKLMRWQNISILVSSQSNFITNFAIKEFGIKT